VKTCQFSGCAIVSRPKLAVTSRELGSTLDKESGPAPGSAPAEAGWVKATSGEGLKTAPLFSLSLAHSPDLAPSAISWAEYDLTPAACCFARAKAALLAWYCLGGQSAISFWMAASRLPGLGDR